MGFVPVLCLILPTFAAAQNARVPPMPSQMGAKSPAKGSAASETDFKALMKKILSAWETLDPANAAPFYAKEVDDVFYDITPLKYTSWAEYADGAKKVVGSFASQRLTLGDDVLVHQHGSFAWATATWHGEIVVKDDGKESLDGRWTVVWEKRGKEWLVVHEHVSVPLPPPNRGHENPTGKLSPSLESQKCAALADLKLPDTTITKAETVAAGAFAPPYPFPVGPLGGFQFVAAKDLAEFCRVAAVAKPSKDSEIKFEVWMPSPSRWNAKFIGVGNRGFSGAVEYLLMDAALSRGYAAASTNTGHDGEPGDASFALGHPEKVIDFGYRAVHEMTLKAKLVIAAYYGTAPKFSYWHGCSTGGRQGLMEAQRFPTDYDGITAGAPANFLTHLQAQAIYTKQAIQKNPAALVPPDKLSVLHKEVVEACDARDGVKDGVLEDPRRCDFDPKRLECKGEDHPSCLTSAQIQLVLKFYGPVVNPRTKEQIFPGYALGSEIGWGDFIGRMMPESIMGRGQYLRYALFQDTNWDYMTFDFDSGMARADRLDGGVTNAINPDLRPFFRRGGKLLQYHGWNDPGISPFNSIDYYNSVVEFMGGADKLEGSYRLFMVPGMDHCAEGEGPNTFDAIGAIEQWVERGKAPERVIASRWTDGKVDRTRPLCPYPQVAKYKGTGSTDDAANFACALP
jgi:feruloyl esterase